MYLDTDAEFEWLEQITQAFRISPRGKRKKKDTLVTPWRHLTEVSKRNVRRKIRLFCLSRLGYTRFHVMEIIRGTIVKGMWKKVESGKKVG